MQYRFALEIPAGTPENAPVTLDAPISYGRLKRYVLYFPAGHAGKTFVQVWYRGRQILPTSLGSAFRGDDILIDSPEDYPLYDPPFELELRGWSPGATYDHTVFCQFYVEVLLLALPAETQRVEIPVFEE